MGEICALFEKGVDQPEAHCEPLLGMNVVVSFHHYTTKLIS